MFFRRFLSENAWTALRTLLLHDTMAERREKERGKEGEEKGVIESFAEQLNEREERELFLGAYEILSLVRRSPLATRIRVAANDDWQTSSIFDAVPSEKKEALLAKASNATHLKPLQRYPFFPSPSSSSFPALLISFAAMPIILILCSLSDEHLSDAWEV
jgi:hypothetical protein